MTIPTTERPASTSSVYRTATDLAAGLRSGAISARQTVDEHIARIEAVNPRLNAIVVPLFAAARAAAAEADERRARGESLGPLHGLPISVKEQFLVAGTPTTFGLTDQAGHRAAEDGPLVRRLREAGSIILGKTNVPQLLYYHESDNPLYGRTNNPWNLARTPGGSSGGDAAIVAAGGAVLAMTSDIGGSTRVPAHFCGLHGLKPTTGRLTIRDTRPGIFAYGQEAVMPQPGVVARTTADVALAFSVLAAPGLEAIDPNVPPVPWRDPAEISVSGLRIAMYTDDGFFPASPALRRAVDVAAASLTSAGATVEPWSPPDVPGAMRLYLGILSADGGAWARKALASSQVDRRLRSLTRIGGLNAPARAALAATLDAARQRRLATTLRSVGRRSASEYWDLVSERNAYRAQFLATLDAGGCDAIICPPHALPALTHGASYYLPTAASYAMLYNLLGMPAGVVPVTRVGRREETDRHRSADRVERVARSVDKGSAGLPIGVQVVARHWREDIVLAVMSAIEARVRELPEYPLRPPL